MSIEDIINLINQLVKDKDMSDREKTKIASKIKRLYNIKKHELKREGEEVNTRQLDTIIDLFTSNYELFKNNGIINEVMQEIAQEYSSMVPSEELSKEAIDNKVIGIYQYILGNTGTNTKGMASDYVANVIKLKITEKDGINRDDIINILFEQSKNMYLDIEEYQKLINDSVISYCADNSRVNSFTNPKILQIFESYAASYKISENFDKVREIYEQALEMKNLERTPEYQELKSHYTEFLAFMDMKTDFEDRRFDSFKDLLDSLEKDFTESDIFEEGHRESVPHPTPRNNPATTADIYVMTVNQKLEGLKNLVNALKKVNEDFDIKHCEVGRNAYNGYVILKIEGTNISIFENFNEVNARLYIVKNELIDKVRRLSRSDATAVDGVEAVNHVSNFDNYCKNLRAKTIRLIKETSPSKDDEEEINFDVLVDEKDTRASKDTEEITEKNNSDVVVENDEKIDKTEDEVSKPDSLVEAERRKAHENLEYLRQLEAEIEKIQREADEKIAKIREEMSNINNSNQHK